MARLDTDSTSAELRPILQTSKASRPSVLIVADQWPLGWFCYLAVVGIQAKYGENEAGEGRHYLKLNDMATAKQQRKTRL